MGERDREKGKARGFFKNPQSTVYTYLLLQLGFYLGVSVDSQFQSPRALKMIDFARVQKELQECSRDVEKSGIKVTPKSDGSLARLIGTIPGPTGTPYEDGTFQIDITLPGPLNCVFVELN